MSAGRERQRRDQLEASPRDQGEEEGQRQSSCQLPLMSLPLLLIGRSKVRRRRLRATNPSVEVLSILTSAALLCELVDWLVDSLCVPYCPSTQANKKS